MGEAILAKGGIVREIQNTVVIIESLNMKTCYNGTYTVQLDGNYRINCVGGGGGAGSWKGGAGGGSGFFNSVDVYLNKGETIPITIGVGGKCNNNYIANFDYQSSYCTYTQINGTAGGTTSFGTYVAANGGTGGTGSGWLWYWYSNTCSNIKYGNGGNGFNSGENETNNKFTTTSSDVSRLGGRLFTENGYGIYNNSNTYNTPLNYGDGGSSLNAYWTYNIANTPGTNTGGGNSGYVSIMYLD